MTELEVLRAENAELRARLNAVTGEDVVLDIRRRFRLKLQAAKLLAFMVARSPLPATRPAIEELLWGDDRDGGPATVRTVINQHIFHVRAALKACRAPGEISVVWGTGYSASADLAAWVRSEIGD